VGMAIGPSSGWQVTSVSTDLPGIPASLALDQMDQPHIAFPVWLPSTLSGIAYATRMGSGYAIERLSIPNNTLFWSSIARDPMGTPHIACVNANARTLMYVSRNTDWIFETVKSTGDAARGIYPSLAFDTKGMPHLAHVEVGAGVLYYSH